MELKQIFEKMDRAIVTGDQKSIERMEFHTKRAIIFHIKIMK